MSATSAATHAGLAGADAPAADRPESPRRSSRLDVLRSSVLIGASSLGSLAIGLVRAKLFAVLLGPTGFGLIGLYSAVLDLARSVATLGLASAGVRQVALARTSHDEQALARTAALVRHTSVLLGVVGAAGLVLLAGPVSMATFGDAGHRAGVVWLGAAVFCGCLGAGQQALLQGTRRIGDLAIASVAGALLGTLAGLPVVYVWREAGIPLSIAAAAVATVVANGWYSRRVGGGAPPAMRWGEWMRGVGALLELGFAFMASGVFVAAAAYAVRAILANRLDLASAGLYQAAWTVAGLYVGFVLQAMGTDFYPRLVESSQNAAETNRLVNEQVEVSLLLALPGVLVTIALAQPVLGAMFSHRFDGAAGVLRWLCVGMALRVFTWPMGFIVAAQGRQWLFLSLDLLWAVAATAMAWVLVGAVGIEGSGIAFAGAYLLHAVVLLPVVRRLTGFRWTRGNLQRAGSGALLIAAAAGAFGVLGDRAATLVAALLAFGCTAICLRDVLGLLPTGRVPPSLARLLGRRTAPAPAAPVTAATEPST